MHFFVGRGAWDPFAKTTDAGLLLSVVDGLLHILFSTLGTQGKTTDALTGFWAEVGPWDFQLILLKTLRVRPTVTCESWWPLCHWPHPGVSVPLAMLAALPLAAVGVAHEIMRATGPV